MSGILERMILGGDAIAKTQSENLKLIFPEKELRSLSPKFHIHVSVSDLYIPTIGLPIMLQENMWTDPGDCGRAIPFLGIHKWDFRCNANDSIHGTSFI